MNQKQAESIAEALWQARQTGIPCPPPTETHPGLSLETAYLASKVNFARRVSQPGIQAIGKKIGLTARAVQTQLGVLEPDFGYLSSDMLLEDGGALPRGSLMQGKVEGEVAFILGERLLGTRLTRADILRATDSVCVAIEIIDSRVKDWKIKIQDTVADNASSAFFVLGKNAVPIGSVDLVAARMELRLNGQLRSEGVGKACLDDPVNAVTWLANKMGEFDVALEAGDIILSGAYGPVVPVQPGDETEVSIAGLGSVKFIYEK